MKYTGPKAKKCRRHGTNLYGSDKYDKILQKKPYGPGKTPKSRPSRASEFARQLMEKQKVREIYGLSERQFHRLYVTASTGMGDTGDAMKQLLERRLDNTIYRAGFAMTRMQARQMAGHGLFQVNGVRVTTPSYQIQAGDVITPRPRTKQSPLLAAVLAAHEKYMPPSWMRVDTSALKAEIVSLPDAASAEQGIDVRQVIEFYSR